MIDIASLKVELESRIAASDTPADILKSKEFRELYASIPTLAVDERKEFGQKVNELKETIARAVAKRQEQLSAKELPAIDITAPFDVNAAMPALLPSDQGTIHPLMNEIETISDIFNRMGFVTEESREIDDQYHMFESLNFPKGHPARDDWDTFMTVETDASGDPLIAPAHTSTMQNRVMRKYHDNLENNQPIAVIVPDRTFRNEDLDARHEHTFYQVEGVYVAKGVHAGMLIATLQAFLEEYYGRQLEVRVNPFYFPFTEPSFEFALSCPFCDKQGCNICSQSGWIELLGCGMIHPNVLKEADIDPTIYTGFAFGCGIDRLVMMKYQIEDIRHLESGKLDFLRQFSA
ncbi:Phenylalanine--tRNA ligase alpha subunit [Candidatus Saccharimonas aalborgensis]|jgi:phenylalanyl-tRNA synthetase alpha chain|uniref:phenylalanine--tRNA ligase n=1 Tax=Candidatus Saccharimonas aalborgensis TaxID=1332188 RepID=R4PJZ9_9BACT|nr:phenylalanine--tRNA ligase subunit alpha [Candidatus Saccharimonas aalborgensis]AGL61823.1 Phenylalanine--tRNA ligase alpha subunit [Candidatus Saccharimonas aalborgensis]MBP7775108.1 phenylalanine--tRNA ligase subunit alpha [Candidatus Saccharimonas sp.]QQS68354.1 MAG: phenylalanine--tRNA ligase subunit alpha [Candidatus Saccharibacteria bacterium]QQS70677.1 MAG: phenylalanine--tRNA ligase subunit alpha [Candidatus Saccharibacteria bacterium]